MRNWKSFSAFIGTCLLAGPVFAAAAATASAEQSEVGLPQFAFNTFPSQLFWLAVSFGSLYLLMAGAALPRIKQGMTARAAHIKNLLADATRLRDEAESHKHEAGSSTDAAYKQAHDALNKAALAAQEIANRRNHELEAILMVKQRASEERIAAARAGAVQCVREASQILVPLIVQKLAGVKLSDSQISGAVHSAGNNVSLRGAA
jgi:F-type H+-transporting ATPase subunit b